EAHRVARRVEPTIRPALAGARRDEITIGPRAVGVRHDDVGGQPLVARELDTHGSLAVEEDLPHLGAETKLAAETLDEADEAAHDGARAPHREVDAPVPLEERDQA